MSDKRAALDWASRLYARRCCGQTLETENRYHGDFPCESVVSEAPLPVSSNLRDHQYAWSEFRRIFNERWEER